MRDRAAFEKSTFMSWRYFLGIRIEKEGNNHCVGTLHISRSVERGKTSQKKKGRMVPTTYEVYVPPTPPFPANATTYAVYFIDKKR